MRLSTPVDNPAVAERATACGTGKKITMLIVANTARNAGIRGLLGLYLRGNEAVFVFSRAPCRDWHVPCFPLLSRKANGGLQKTN
jgi:hypothetical protein